MRLPSWGASVRFYSVGDHYGQGRGRLAMTDRGAWDPDGRRREGTKKVRSTDHVPFEISVPNISSRV
jgi:hypothetical protein